MELEEKNMKIRKWRRKGRRKARRKTRRKVKKKYTKVVRMKEGKKQ